MVGRSLRKLLCLLLVVVCKFKGEKVHCFSMFMSSCLSRKIKNNPLEKVPGAVVYAGHVMVDSIVDSFAHPIDKVRQRRQRQIER